MKSCSLQLTSEIFKLSIQVTFREIWTESFILSTGVDPSHSTAAYMCRLNKKGSVWSSLDWQAPKDGQKGTMAETLIKNEGNSLHGNNDNSWYMANEIMFASDMHSTHFIYHLLKKKIKKKAQNMHIQNLKT